MKAGLKKVHSLCKKHLVYQVWGQIWVVALPGFSKSSILILKPSFLKLEAKTQHLKLKSSIFKLKSLKPSI